MRSVNISALASKYLVVIQIAIARTLSITDPTSACDMIPGKNKLVTDCAMAQPTMAAYMSTIVNILMA